MHEPAVWPKKEANFPLATSQSDEPTQPHPALATPCASKPPTPRCKPMRPRRREAAMARSSSSSCLHSDGQPTSVVDIPGDGNGWTQFCTSSYQIGVHPSQPVVVHQQRNSYFTTSQVKSRRPSHCFNPPTVTGRQAS